MLSLETQKRLTEFDGSCWHEDGWIPCHGGPVLGCKKCGNLTGSVGRFLDFDDWRVVMRLITKLTDDKEITHEQCRKIEISIWGGPESVCLAIDAYLEKEEWK